MSMYPDTYNNRVAALTMGSTAALIISFASLPAFGLGGLAVLAPLPVLYTVAEIARYRYERRTGE